MTEARKTHMHSSNGGQEELCGITGVTSGLLGEGSRGGRPADKGAAACAQPGGGGWAYGAHAARCLCWKRGKRRCSDGCRMARVDWRGCPAGSFGGLRCSSPGQACSPRPRIHVKPVTRLQGRGSRRDIVGFEAFSSSRATPPAATSSTRCGFFSNGKGK